MNTKYYADIYQGICLTREGEDIRGYSPHLQLQSSPLPPKKLDKFRKCINIERTRENQTILGWHSTSPLVGRAERSWSGKVR